MNKIFLVINKIKQNDHDIRFYERLNRNFHAVFHKLLNEPEMMIKL